MDDKNDGVQTQNFPLTLYDANTFGKTVFEEAVMTSSPPIVAVVDVDVADDVRDIVDADIDDPRDLDSSDEHLDVDDDDAPEFVDKRDVIVYDDVTDNVAGPAPAPAECREKDFPADDVIVDVIDNVAVGDGVDFAETAPCEQHRPRTLSKPDATAFGGYIVKTLSIVARSMHTRVFPTPARTAVS